MATNTDFNLMVNAVVDTSKAEQQIANFTKKREIVTVVKIEDKSTNQIETRIQKVNTLVDNYGKTVKKVEQYDLMGNLKDSKIKSVSDSFKSLNTQTTKYKDSLGNVITEIKNFDEYGNSMTKQIKEYVDAQGYAVKETRNFDATGQQVGETIRNLSKDLTQEASAAQEAGKASSEFGITWEQITKRFGPINIVARGIQDTITGIRQALSDTIDVIKQFDAAITEMGKVSQYSGQELLQYAQQLGELGVEVGRTTSQMVEGTTGWLKAGFDEKLAANLAKTSSLLQNTVDEEIDAAEATSILVSQIKAFEGEIGQGKAYSSIEEFATHASDSINKVSADFAVSSADISKGLTQAGASLATYGNSFDETVGLITAGTEIFQGKSQQVARGLNMIASRITKNEKTLKDFGISLEKEDGSLKSTYEVLGELSEQWDTLDEKTRISVGTTLSGVNQYKIFAAVMSNFAHAQDAATTSMESAGATAAQNAIYMDSIEAKTSLLKAELEKLVIGNGGLQDFVKKLLDLGLSIVKFSESDLGKLTIGLLALVPVLLKVQATWGSLSVMFNSNVITSAIMSLIAGEATLGQVTDVLSAKFLENAAAWLATPMGQATLIVGSIAALVITANKFNNTLENQVEKLNDCVDAYNRAQSEVKSLENELKQVKDKIEEINAQGGAQVADKEQLQELEKQEQALIRQLALKKQIAEEARKAAEEAAKEALNSQVKITKDTGLVDTTLLADPTWVIEKSTEAYAKNQEQIESLTASLMDYVDSNGNVISGNEEVVDEINDEIDALENENDAISEVANSIVDNFGIIVDSLPEGEVKEAIEGLIDGWLDVTGATKAAEAEILNTDDALEEEEEAIDEDTARLEALAEAHGIAVDDLNKLAKATGMSAEALLDYADAMGVSVEQAASYIQSIESWNNSIDSLQDAYGKLTSAVEEYNSAGELSLDTLQNLLALSPEYLAMLTEENGKLVLNEQAIINKAQALIEERKQIALQIAYDKLAAIERGNNANAADNEASSVSGNTGALQEETSALSMNTIEQMRNKIARSGNSADTSAANKVVRELQNELKVIDKIGQQYGKVSTSAIKSGNDRSKASKGASKAIDEETKALQDLKKQYETVISWINKQYDRKIKEIQKAKSAAVGAVEDEINALKKREKAELDSITKTINARKSEKKEALDAIELQIKLIEKEEDLRIGSLKKDKKALEKQRDDELDDLQDKIDLLKEQKDAVLDATQTEIDSLKELKEERQAYWDEEINRLKEANEERKDALELQQYLDNLEKAKNTKVKVYKQDEGFVYDTDQTQVNQAQEALDKYLSEKAYEDELARLEALKQAELENYQDRIDELTKFKEGEAKNYQAQIDDLTKLKNERKKVYEEELDALTELIEAEQEQYDIRLELLEEQKDVTTEYYEVMIDELEEYKDTVEESYEQQIEALEAHKDALEDNYDKEIEMYRNYKEQFQDMVDEYENAQAKLLFEQLTGLSAENDNWMTRLDNLRQFVNAYNSLQAQLNTATTNASASYGGTGSVNYKPVATTTTPKTTTTTTTKQYSPTTGVDSKGYNTYGTTSSSPTSTGDAASREALARINHKATTYATGVDKVPDDKVALVGEAPNTELVIGSKINSGKLMSLPKDTGVVNAKSTKSMAGLLNQLGQFGGSAFGAGNGTLNNNTTSNDNSFNVNGVTINGANITDPQSFATALLNFKNQALQRAYKRV